MHFRNHHVDVDIINEPCGEPQRQAKLTKVLSHAHLNADNLTVPWMRQLPGEHDQNLNMTADCQSMQLNDIGLHNFVP